MSDIDNLIILLSIIMIVVTIVYAFVFRKKKPSIPESKPLSKDTNINLSFQELLPEPEDKDIVELNIPVAIEIDQNIPPFNIEDEIPTTVNIDRPMIVLDIEKVDVNQAIDLVEQFGTYDHTLVLSSYKYPTLDLLENQVSKMNLTSDELGAKKQKIIDVLRSYDVEVEKITATIGPTVILYEFVPAAGIRISKIKALENDIALSLVAFGIRIIAPMPGKGTIGIEVPNENPDIVSMRSMLTTEKFLNTTMDLPIALGKTMTNL